MLMAFLLAGVLSAFAAATAAYIAGQSIFMIIVAYSAGGAIGGLLAVMFILAIQYALSTENALDADAGDVAQTAAS